MSETKTEKEVMRDLAVSPMIFSRTLLSLLLAKRLITMGEFQAEYDKTLKSFKENLSDETREALFGKD